MKDRENDDATALGLEVDAEWDEAALNDFRSKGAILNFKEASWSNREISGDRGELNGSITTDGGGVVPIKLVLVKENDAWKIDSLQRPTAGVQSEHASETVPTQADQTALVKQAMHDFLVSVGEKSMEHFRSTLSSMWQGQPSTEQLDDAFRVIIDSEADWSVPDGFEPIISSEATINENGVLTVAGYYPTQPSRVHFEQRYLREGVAWKLIGFNIEAKAE